jgi:hypothetical protein
MSLLKKIFLIVMGCGLIVDLSGCGYTTRSQIADNYKTIHITPFVNKIDLTRESDAANKYKLYRPMLEQDIAQAVVSRFLLDGNLRSVKEGASDLTLRGELMEYRRDPLRYTTTDEVEEYRISLVVNIVLWDNKENKMLWKEDSFIGDTTYFTMGQAAKTDDAAVNDAVKDLARRIVERAVEQW